MHNSHTGAFSYPTDGAYARYSLQAMDATSKLSRPANDGDSFAIILGHLCEASVLVDAETVKDGAVAYSNVAHQSIVKDGTCTGIANGAVAIGDQVKLQPAANAGKLGTAGAGPVMGLAVTAAADGEYFGYVPKPGV